ncbi:Bug family tripartite tricarboxylate transporter substrate binding protein [Ottowia thiooxydans]|uniref:Bug family tripartite tricarboxylate transporter substrate binding protein n=1 Tax=Ottowia thiooxydans TaxID=219182 RepID=UPI0003F64F66|nr:tripartite tricarboxylate transporter substrate binding protein [Ottowia thiooxydans]
MHASHLALTRRHLLGLAAGLAATNVSAQPAPWPSRPLRIVVAFPPGGLADVLIRMLVPQLTEVLGQPVVIDNRGGASGNVAGVEVARNGGDGHTLLVNVTTLESVNPLMFGRMPLDPAKELQHVALLANTQLFLVTRPTLVSNTLAEFVAYARANPGKLSYGSAGNGTTPHVGGELFKQTAGIFATHIPYRGMAPAIQDVMAGQIDYAFVPGTVFPSVKAGKLKLLAVASRQRASYYTAAPTVNELGFGPVYVDTPFAVYAPAAMPAANVAHFNRELNKLLMQPAIKARFADVGAEPVALSPAELTAMVKAESALFGPIVKARGIKAD